MRVRDSVGGSAVVRTSSNRARKCPDRHLTVECDRVGDGQADYSRKPRRHGVNAQVVAELGGRLRGARPPCPAALTT